MQIFWRNQRWVLRACQNADDVAAEKKRSICKVIKAEFKRADATYGSPRITGEIVDLGHTVSENTVAKYMQELGLDARLKKRFRVMTTDSNHTSPIAARLVKTEVKETLRPVLARCSQEISPILSAALLFCI